MGLLKPYVGYYGCIDECLILIDGHKSAAIFFYQCRDYLVNADVWGMRWVMSGVGYIGDLLFKKVGGRRITADPLTLLRPSECGSVACPPSVAASAGLRTLARNTRSSTAQHNISSSESRGAPLEAARTG